MEDGQVGGGIGGLQPVSDRVSYQACTAQEDGGVCVMYVCVYVCCMWNVAVDFQVDSQRGF